MRTTHPSRHSLRLGVTLAGFVAALAAADALGQFPPPAPPPAPSLPPLMYVRVAGPKGMKVTVYRGSAKGQTADAPATLGLRPGYFYRLALSDLPGQPNQVFFPTLEVRGSLLLSSRLRNADFPATLNFYDEDFTRAQSGTLVKKVIVLERPETAIPKASRPEEPIELIVPAPRDPVHEAQDRGQPLVVAQMGQRHYTPEEMAGSVLPGTLLMPGEKVLPHPTFPPQARWACFPVFDLVHGPAHPGELVTVFDGGDSGLPVAALQDGRLRGFDPSDTVAQYTDSKGRPQLAISNRVGLCIPRYLVARGEINLAAHVSQFGTGNANAIYGHDVASARLILAMEEKRLHLEKLNQKQRTSGTTNTYGTAITGRSQGLEMKTTLAAIHVVDGVCVRPEPDAPKDRPLLIIKWPDKMGALVGDTLTFFLRFTNQGGQPIGNVVVSDNLTSRFEYVPGSAKADREAIFTTQPNDVGSSVLRWEFGGALQPRESGLISFQVRVR